MMDLENCPVCRSALDADSKFCDVCGASAFGNLKCPKCGGVVSSTARFCKHCSNDLSGLTRRSSGQLPTALVAGAATVLIVALLVLGYAYYSSRQTVATLEGRNAELQKQLDEKAGDLAQKGDLIAQKTGEISNLNGTLEQREKDVADKTDEIKKLTGSLTVVSTCISGMLRSNAAERDQDYATALIALRQVMPSCRKSGEVIKKFDKFR